MYEARAYGTRIDRFRRKEGIRLRLWAQEAGINRTQFGKYRAGKQEPSAIALANIVRAARRITGKPVRAAELYDVGDDEPLNTLAPEPFFEKRGTVRHVYNTRLDQCLIREGIKPARLARASGISRLALHRKRSGREIPRVSAIAKLVKAMRRLGRDVTASDLFDVGEDL
jgi:transcriptional regulator with XRE-family HTH domain